MITPDNRRRFISTNGLNALLANITIYLKGKNLDGGRVSVEEFEQFMQFMENLLMADPAALSETEHDTFVSTQQVLFRQLHKTDRNWELLRFWYDSFQR